MLETQFELYKDNRNLKNLTILRQKYYKNYSNEKMTKIINILKELLMKYYFNIKWK